MLKLLAGNGFQLFDLSLNQKLSTCKEPFGRRIIYFVPCFRIMMVQKFQKLIFQKIPKFIFFFLRNYGLDFIHPALNPKLQTCRGVLEKNPCFCSLQQNPDMRISKSTFSFDSTQNNQTHISPYPKNFISLSKSQSNNIFQW